MKTVFFLSLQYGSSEGLPPPTPEDLKTGLSSESWISKTHTHRQGLAMEYKNNGNSKMKNGSNHNAKDWLRKCQSNQKWSQELFQGDVTAM